MSEESKIVEQIISKDRNKPGQHNRTCRLDNQSGVLNNDIGRAQNQKKCRAKKKEREMKDLGPINVKPVHRKPLTMDELNTCRGRRVACDGCRRRRRLRPSELNPAESSSPENNRQPQQDNCNRH
jgi:hypothetical protein